MDVKINKKLSPYMIATPNHSEVKKTAFYLCDGHMFEAITN